jgi:CzcA family heavy metal efflux pump
MIDAILRWSLARRPIVLAIAGALLLWGGVTAYQMPVDVFPDLTAPTVTVLTEGHGMAPEELEARVTFPIESALNGAPGVRRIRSSTGVGISIVWVEFDWGIDVARARQVVAEKLQLVRDALPEEVEPPVLAPVSSVMGEILFLAMTSDRHTEMEVRTAADFVVRRRLLAVAGVSQIIPIGGEVRQLQVLLSAERLVAHRVSLRDVLAAVPGSNRSVSAGFVNEHGLEFLVHGAGRVVRPEDVAEAFVVRRGERPLLVRDLGEVRYGAGLRRGTGSFMARPAVVLGIQRQPGANTLELTRRLETEIAELEEALPEGMEIHSGIFRQADFIEVAIRNVLVALRDGVILVLLIVLLFLGSPRASAVTVVAIPLSLVVAVLALHLMGATLNTMTLGGMAIAIGELVDDAIIDVENVLRRLRENAQRPEADRHPSLTVVLEASREIRSSIVFATAAVVLVFLPLFFLSGVEGRLLTPLGVAYVVSLVASLAVAVTVTPALASYALPRAALTLTEEPRVVRWAKALYAPMLARVLDRPVLVAAIALVLVVVAGGSLAFTGRAFLPEFHEGTLTVAMVTMPGISLEESDRLGSRVEEILMAQPEVVSVARRTGRAELDEHAQGVNAAEIDVSLADEPGGRSREELLTALRAAFGELAGVHVTIGQPISHRIDHMLSGTRAAIAVKIFGDDLTELRRLASEVRTAMEGVPGVVDLSIEQQTDVPFARVRFDRAAIAAHGLRIEDVARTLEVGGAGLAVGEVYEGGAVFDLAVRMERTDPGDVDALGSMPVITPEGAVVPMRALATITRERGPSEVAREGVQRKIVVMCNVGSRDLGSVVSDVRAAVGAAVVVPSGYHIAYGGQFESAEEASQRIVLLGLAAILGILLLLSSAFRSVKDALLVMANLPLALVGGVVGVWLEGGVLSIASLVGFVTLFGIATRNGIMLVSHVRNLVELEGVTDLREAVRRAAMERLAPILMTALAAGLALVPLALAGGEPGSEIQSPMAVVILSGLLSSTLLNMLVVPALYLRFGALRGRVHDAPLSTPVPTTV